MVRDLVVVRVILAQDPETGYWIRIEPDPGMILRTHDPAKCEGRLCDVHNRRGAEPWASYPLNWRGDRGVMEVICPCGIGHPTPAQAEYFESLVGSEISRATADAELVHGCCLTHCPLLHLEL